LATRSGQPANPWIDVTANEVHRSPGEPPPESSWREPAGRCCCIQPITEAGVPGATKNSCMSTRCGTTGTFTEYADNAAPEPAGWRADGLAPGGSGTSLSRRRASARAAARL